MGRLGLARSLAFRVGLGRARRGRAGDVSKSGELGPTPRDAVVLLAGIVIAPVCDVMILGSMLPAIDFDVLEYHLQGPKEYYQAGRIAFLPHNVYTSMPFGVEMLHLAAMEVMGDWWWGGLAGQLLVALFAPAAAVLIAATAARAGSPRAGWLAAVVYLSTPWIYRLAVIAYVEGPLCFYHAALVWAAVRRLAAIDRSGRRPIWCLIGLLAGCAMACKYPALISAVIPFGALAAVDCRRSRSLAPLLCYVLGWAIVMGPWLVKNVIDTGNPVYPLGQFDLPRPPLGSSREKRNGRPPTAARRSHCEEFGNSLVDVAGRSDWQSPLYVALAPLAFLRPGHAQAGAGALGVRGLPVRHMVVVHAPAGSVLAAALAAAGGTRGARGRLGREAAAGRSCSASIMTIALVDQSDLYLDRPGRLERVDRRPGLLATDIPRSWNAALARLDTELPPDARPLLVGQAAVFHLDHAVSLQYSLRPGNHRGHGQRQERSKSSGRHFAERKLTHVYVDWKEIQRHRQPGGYGFTDFVQPSRFAHWVAAGVLERPRHLGDRPGNSTRTSLIRASASTAIPDHDSSSYQ